MDYIEVNVEDVRVGDKLRRVQGTSHVCNRAVTYEVVSVKPGCHPKNPALLGVNYKLRDLATGRCKSEFQNAGRTLGVYRNEV